MRFYEKKGKVIKNFNKNGIMYEVGEDYQADRFVYDEMYSNGFVDEGKEVKKEEKLFKNEDF